MVLLDDANDGTPLFSYGTASLSGGQIEDDRVNGDIPTNVSGSLNSWTDEIDTVTQIVRDVDASGNVSFSHDDGLSNDDYVAETGFRIVCFARGTTIQAANGGIPVESLKVGQDIMTRDRGLQPIRWIGSTTVTSPDLDRNPKLRPVRIEAGALGRDYPKTDLVVSRQHRIPLRSKIAQRIFDSAEVLIPAIKLVDIGIQGIYIDESFSDVTYYHLLFDQHEVVISNGAYTESLFTGPEAIKSLSAEARQEFEELFPEVLEPQFVSAPARCIPKGRSVRHLLARHIKNRQPLFS